MRFFKLFWYSLTYKGWYQPWTQNVSAMGTISTMIIHVLIGHSASPAFQTGWWSRHQKHVFALTCVSSSASLAFSCKAIYHLRRLDFYCVTRCNQIGDLLRHGSGNPRIWGTTKPAADMSCRSLETCSNFLSKRDLVSLRTWVKWGVFVVSRPRTLHSSLVDTERLVSLLYPSPSIDLWIIPFWCKAVCSQLYHGFCQIPNELQHSQQVCIGPKKRCRCCCSFWPSLSISFIIWQKKMGYLFPCVYVFPTTSERVFFGVIIPFWPHIRRHSSPLKGMHLGQFLLCLLLRCVRILLLLLEILHDRVQHGDDTGAQVAISGTAQLPGHLGRTRIFLAESCQILGFVEAFHNGLGFLHHFQGEAAVATRGLVGVLLFGSNLQNFARKGGKRRACLALIPIAMIYPNRKWLQQLPPRSTSLSPNPIFNERLDWFPIFNHHPKNIDK